MKHRQLQQNKVHLGNTKLRDCRQREKTTTRNYICGLGRPSPSFLTTEDASNVQTGSCDSVYLIHLTVHLLHV
jgi:hypothetical protein